ncbi:MAG: valine--tRNA ligase [Gemmatimonadaceae bacterium]
MTTDTRPQAELPPRYDAAATESSLYQAWEDAGVFTAHPERSRGSGGNRNPFVIVMPPPNVTAVLHMGHGLNNSVQDVLARWRRMCGDESLWLPGTDHAGIATQNVVEKQVAAEGSTRFDLGRDAFVDRTAAFVAETGGTILDQLRAIGASCDWTRTAYTLSPELSLAVREAFVQLHERGLIYRGHRVIHWCPRCLTSLSDEEAEHVEEMGSLYHIRYSAADGSGDGVTIATTRPETMLGDVAVAVHPDDDRHKHLIGSSVLLPIADIAIPVIADAEGVDPAFGTGAVKITPAHDPSDFEMGRRHGLPMPVVISPEATMINGADAGARVPASLLGLDRLEARDRLVEILQERGRLVKVEAHSHGVRHCYRCDTVVEPRLSDQWFVSMKPLAEPALEAVRSGRIRILPERWEAVYINWLENIRDWNISRQLWWGHRIPVWYCDACGKVTASRNDIGVCPACGGAARQDEDVLDTWFSSWLWPFSTLGWPDMRSADLKAFYPTDDLVTAPEILFFWVARMVMGGYAFMGEAPFHTIYLHGTVRDMKGVKMSKSLGNGIDPLDVVGLYGADALRYTVISGLGVGADLMLDPRDLEKSFAPGRNFVTKLWNIGRFLLANVGDDVVDEVVTLDASRLARADKWILGRLNVAIAECDAALGPVRPVNGVWTDTQLRAGMRLSDYTESGRRFVWNELADWYLESTKGRLSTPGPDRDVARAVLVHSFDAALRLLQPVVPFITETLWRRLPTATGSHEKFLATATWPVHNAAFELDAEFETVRDAVNAIRRLRADYAVSPGAFITASLVTADDEAGERDRRIFSEEAAFIRRLIRCELAIVPPGLAGAAAHSGGATLLLAGGSRVVVPLSGLVDIEKECVKARSELTRLDTQLDSLNARLANPGFTDRAPPEVVAAERQKAGEWSSRREQLSGKVKSLCG